MLVPLMMITILIENPNGLLAVGLSLFPLTAPVTMAARLVSAPVPGWQIALASLLIVLATIGVLRVAARWFESQALHAGEQHGLLRLWQRIT
jgi:ABC-2 type transport system permease protein